VQFVGRATIYGTLYEVQGHYFPGIVLDHSQRVVQGEVYQINRQALVWLDAFEGYQHTDYQRSFFLRREVTAQLDDGKQVNCSAYEINAAQFRLGNVVESGDWNQHITISHQK
jgi:gamma-glutamylcyclotransferase (GGCT)/AIG2-like uncharacterized protein YtfP